MEKASKRKLLSVKGETKRRRVDSEDGIRQTMVKTRSMSVLNSTKSKPFNSGGNSSQTVVVELSRELASYIIYYDKEREHGQQNLFKGKYSDGTDIMVRKIKSNSITVCAHPELIANLRHESVMPFREILTTYSFIYVISDGFQLTLTEVMEKETILDQMEKIVSFQQIIEGIHFLHSNNIRHGNLNSQNVVLERGDRLKFVITGLEQCTVIQWSEKITVFRDHSNYTLNKWANRDNWIYPTNCNEFQRTIWRHRLICQSAQLNKAFIGKMGVERTLLKDYNSKLRNFKNTCLPEKLSVKDEPPLVKEYVENWNMARQRFEESRVKCANDYLVRKMKNCRQDLRRTYKSDLQQCGKILRELFDKIDHRHKREEPHLTALVDYFIDLMHSKEMGAVPEAAQIIDSPLFWPTGKLRLYFTHVHNWMQSDLLGSHFDNEMTSTVLGTTGWIDVFGLYKTGAEPWHGLEGITDEEEMKCRKLIRRCGYLKSERRPKEWSRVVRMSSRNDRYFLDNCEDGYRGDQLHQLLRHTRDMCCRWTYPRGPSLDWYVCEMMRKYPLFLTATYSFTMAHQLAPVQLKRDFMSDIHRMTFMSDVCPYTDLFNDLIGMGSFPQEE